MMRSVSSIVTTRPGDWGRLVAAYLWLYRARRLMKRAHGKQWLVHDRADERSAGEVRNRRPQPGDMTLIKSRVAAISRASRHPTAWAFCLQRSLALREWLAKDGILTEIRYGVRMSDGSFDAHAWVVYDGKIVNDSVRHISTFAPLRSLEDFGEGQGDKISDAIVSSRSENDDTGR